MSFKELKSKRDARLNQAGTAQPSVLSEKETGNDQNQLYSQLDGSGLIIKSVSGRGRGLWATTTMKPGSKLLSLPPHIHVLSARFLDTHCSRCTIEAEVRRCTKCLTVSYCSTDCQREDWKLHKEECKAILRWKAASPDGTPPADSIRAIGRLLWSRKLMKATSDWWLEVNAMQSNRDVLSLETQESFTHFAQSLVIYLDVNSPEGLRDFGIDSARDLVDLMSKFAANSFTLTSSNLSSLGVAISPLPALINHSCQPNAVIVFPRATATKPPTLEVIAILPINPEDEILAAYVDVTLPTELRQKSLEATYNFTCQCAVCTNTEEVDLRSSCYCPKCSEGYVRIKDRGKASVCTKCGAALVVSDDVKDKLRVAAEGLQKAEKLQWTESEQALRLTTNILSLITPFSPPSAHPRLALMRLQQTLLISELRPQDGKIDDIIRVSAQVVAGLCDLLPLGHPIRAVALAEFGKLLCVDEPALSEEEQVRNSFPPRGYHRLVLAKDTLVRANNEVQIGFGPGGGGLRDEVRAILENIDREMAVYRKGVTNLRASATQKK